jgi:hypothetical protein
MSRYTFRPSAATPADRARNARLALEQVFGRAPFREFFDTLETIFREHLVEHEVDVRREYETNE